MARKSPITTLNVSLPESMREWILARLTEGSYSSASEYVRELVRKDQEQKGKEALESKLLEGLRSGKSIEVTDKFWEKKLRRFAERKKTSSGK
jgi:antitoxin ParD1/3/4